jgi:hypothetical protein
MAGTWIDPDDIRPDARRVPRSITGLRRYDPLRKLSGNAHSGISALHIMAADSFREQVDLAMLGYSGVRPLIFVAQSPEPRWGLGPGALAQMRATRSVKRVLKLFDVAQLWMLDAIVLQNITLTQWTRSRDPVAAIRTEKTKLLVILDILAEYYDADVQDDLAKGKRLL